MSSEVTEVDNDGEPWTPNGTYECQFNGQHCDRCQLSAPQNDCRDLWKEKDEMNDDMSEHNPAAPNCVQHRHEMIERLARDLLEADFGDGAWEKSDYAHCRQARLNMARKLIVRGWLRYGEQETHG